MAKKQGNIAAIDIKRGTTIGLPTGGSFIASPGDVLLVGKEISLDDARYLCGMDKAEPCKVELKVERAKEKAAEEADKKK